MIKPNQLCELIRTGHPQLDGRFVVTIRYVGTHTTDVITGYQRYGFLWLKRRPIVRRNIVMDAWEVQAPWTDNPCFASTCCLRPISDPDLSVDETTEEEMVA